MNPPTPTTATPVLGALRARWSQLAPREKSLLAGAIGIVVLALIWQFLLAPSLLTLRTANTQGQALDAQLQRMQSLQAQAKALQKQAPMTYEDAVRALTQSTKQTLGTTAQVSVTGERANITLQAASADALAQWLAQARLNARSTPLEARLTRMATPAGVTWTGMLVMSLPQRQ